MRKDAKGHYVVVCGGLRLRAVLDLGMPATVRDIESGQELEMHDVGGRLVALSGTASQKVAAAADALIDAVRKA